MDATRLLTRRDAARGIAATVAASTLPCPSFAQSAARIAVIGGGFAGASCARALRRLDPGLKVTLIEPNRSFAACLLTNVQDGSAVLGAASSWLVEHLLGIDITPPATPAPLPRDSATPRLSPGPRRAPTASPTRSS